MYHFIGKYKRKEDKTNMYIFLNTHRSDHSETEHLICLSHRILIFFFCKHDKMEVNQEEDF